MDNPTEVPLIEDEDGTVRDMLVENLLTVIVQQRYTEANFDKVFTRVVREYINEESPDLIPSFAGRDGSSASAVHYLALLGLDFDFIFPQSPYWVHSPFLPNAMCCCRVGYANGQDYTDWFPGKSINQAALGSIVQLAREIAVSHYNQHHLDLDEPHKEPPNAH